MRQTLLLVLLVALAGCHRVQTDPKVQTRILMEAVSMADWKGLYEVSAFPPSQANSNADNFANSFGKGFEETGGAPARQLLRSMAEIVIGTPAITGDKAKIPVDYVVTLDGKRVHMSGVANMLNEGGTWKWDLRSDGNFETQITTQLKALIGHPQF